MRRALLLVLLLLMPAVGAEETESWTVEVEDPLGNPISDCDIVLNEPWTGTIIESPSGGMYQASGTCDGYVVMWHPPIPSSQTTVVLTSLLKSVSEYNWQSPPLVLAPPSGASPMKLVNATHKCMSLHSWAHSATFLFATGKPAALVNTGSGLALLTLLSVSCPFTRKSYPLAQAGAHVELYVFATSFHTTDP